MSDRSDHGWWPYVLPMAAFLALVEIGRRAPDSAFVLFLALKALVPGALMVYFARRGRYPELAGRGVSLPWLGLDLAFGVALAALWIAPYVLFPSWRPDETGSTGVALGPDSEPWWLALRLLGFAAVTPFFEELFIRSFAMRAADAWSTGKDFRLLPLAQFAWPSFLFTVVLFTVNHQPWEYPVCVAWIVLTHLWFYWRRDLWAVIWVHAATNAAILAAAVWGSSWFDDGSGKPLSLWFFV
ncbi:MAG: CPBP family glutamic-type intramembrane protease [Proteobacteria bacterium]|nr:CPBP family glutamic-type intramembrane protease [Pseudomonadota bacterium]